MPKTVEFICFAPEWRCFSGCIAPFFSMFFHMFSASMNSMDRNSTGMATLAPAPAPAKACWAQPQGGAKTHGATDGEALRQLGGC